MVIEEVNKENVSEYYQIAQKNDKIHGTGVQKITHFV